MFENLSFEALAHYMRGMATMFFIIQSVLCYKSRMRDRMSYTLFVALSYITLCYMKDIVFLVIPWMESQAMQDMVSLVDLTCTPFVCAYFHEATCPGVVTVRRLLFIYGLFVVFLPLYVLFRHIWVVYAAYGFSAIVASVTVFSVIINSIRYGKCLADNYSYTQDLSVRWIVKSTCTYFAWFVVYFVCFTPTTWFGEVVFDVFSLVFWSFLAVLSRKHRVIEEMLQNEDQMSARDMQEEKPKSKKRRVEEALDEESLAERDAYFTEVLERSMQVDKLYLNPRLTLGDLAAAVGSNRSYLSDYINRQGKTFYDFVNEYRVAEACRILDGSMSEENVSMPDVALRSGFNSLSSFYRYFSKLKGVTPTKYQDD